METSPPCFNLEEYLITQKKSANTIYYIPNFIDKAEEESLLRNVYRVPKPKWTQLSNRRLQNWGGVPMPKGMLAEEIPNWLKFYTEKIGSLNIFDNNCTPNHVLVNEYLSGQGIMPHLDGSLFHPTITTINLGSHTFLNFYNPIIESTRMPDTDDADSTTNIPDSTTVSCSESSESNSSCIKSWPERLAFSLLLEPRSLVILKDRAYNHYLHGIDETSCDTISEDILNIDKITDYPTTIGTTIERSTRISLTIRHVPKTTKRPIFVLGR